MQQGLEDVRGELRRMTGQVRGVRADVEAERQRCLAYMRETQLQVETLRQKVIEEVSQRLRGGGALLLLWGPPGAFPCLET